MLPVNVKPARPPTSALVSPAEAPFEDDVVAYAQVGRGAKALVP